MKPQVSIIDLGGGNLASVANAVKEVGGDPWWARTPGRATHIIVPGQGAFSDIPPDIRSGLTEAWIAGIPILGICLGMQLMCEGSEEAPGVKGLGWIEGVCRRLEGPRLPHIGWSNIVLPSAANPEHEAAKGFYFCHSYALHPDQPIMDNKAPWGGAFAEYAGKMFMAIVLSGNLWAVQFHPEKSGKAGLAFLREFLKL